MNLDKNYWQSRYQNKQTGWDLGKVSRPLQQYIDQLEDKEISILIPGAGNGHEVIYLWQQGFKNIFVIDIAREPLDHIQKQLPDIPKSHLIQDDFFNHIGLYDLILEQTFFCALQIRFRESYFKKIAQLLHPNGKLVGVWFTFTQYRHEPPYGGNAQEYQQLLKDYFNINRIEDCYNSEKSRQGKEIFLNLSKK